MKKGSFPVILIIITLLFFWKFFLQGLFPIPADTIIGMYHPWRDLFAEKYPNGIPFKNFLITDSVRQQYPWRQLAIDIFKKKQLPLWNPYTFAGAPLLANLQSACLYPLNILFFIIPFDFAWSILIILQPLLAALFLFLYLRHFNLRIEACFLGAISFAFSGFFIAWLEWNTILHSALWLSLILLSVDKIMKLLHNFEKTKNRQQKTEIKNKKHLLFWSSIFTFSLVSSFFAGHLQTFFYVFLASLIYIVVRTLSGKKEKNKTILLFVICYLLFTALSAVQWLPTLNFINLSARGADQVNWQKEGWFIPWQHLAQFFAPDFFGNPTTLNYWGTWNYGELIGYIGVLPLIMAFLAMIWRRDKKTLLFGTFFFLSLIFALPTWFAKLPYQLKIPFLSTSQPTRLLFLTDFSLAILAALGFDFFLRKKVKTSQTIKLLTLFGLIFGGFWLFVLFSGRWLNTEQWMIDLAVAKRNLILPTGIFIIIAILLITKVLHFCHLRGGQVEDDWSSSSDGEGFQKCKTLIITVFLLITVIFDLFRFGWKFTPFVKREYLFPSAKTIEFLKKDKEVFRFMTTDKRVFPPNFSIVYKLQTIDGYDPLYSLRYGELIAASERRKSDIFKPLGFNRIISPHNYESRIIDLLNVKYILSLKEEEHSKLKKVFQEGKTRVYENVNAFPRAFLVESVIKVNDKQEAIEKMFDQSIDLGREAIVYDDINIDNEPLINDEKVEIMKYSENSVVLEVKTEAKRLLILADSYYPNWRALVDGQEDKVYQVNYNLRGVVIPSGRHKIDFRYLP